MQNKSEFNSTNSKEFYQDEYDNVPCHRNEYINNQHKNVDYTNNNYVHEMSLINNTENLQNSNNSNLISVKNELTQIYNNFPFTYEDVDITCKEKKNDQIKMYEKENVNIYNEQNEQNEVVQISEKKSERPIGLQKKKKKKKIKRKKY
ncbi:hypothetical protein PFFVO_00585 [Plasmodium falciparum Vietnam Oak-Knoll (FVO)]|uniref:Uncharacterized protein n=1 Tax=Plasmodium falciparum Vietnam Oak-Knoll (FVO) TaxID=1036723 RepID=A0A024VBX0_PLAFA|nr:hypothetical protein PFFVO_00585 [Plasmodium falciparum Vietnam Oak-Knoll (FVO)]